MGTERVGNRRTRRNHSNYRIVEISLNSKKSSEDLLLLTPVKDYQLTLVRKINNNNDDNLNTEFESTYLFCGPIHFNIYIYI